MYWCNLSPPNDDILVLNHYVLNFAILLKSPECTLVKAEVIVQLGLIVLGKISKYLCNILKFLVCYLVTSTFYLRSP
jgi:hypothetical protein